MQNVKMVLVGSTGVGKTCSLISYTTNAFPTEYVPTVSDDFTANVKVGDKVVSLSLWDTTGSPGYDVLRPLSYHATDVFCIMFSVTDRASFDDVSAKWVPELRHHAPGVPIVLAGNKTDLDDSRVIGDAHGRELARDIGAVDFFAISALNQSNLASMFNAAILASLRKSTKKEQCALL